jgi:hypothetical protein
MQCGIQDTARGSIYAGDPDTLGIWKKRESRKAKDPDTAEDP